MLLASLRNRSEREEQNEGDFLQKAKHELQSIGGNDGTKKPTSRQLTLLHQMTLGKDRTKDDGVAVKNSDLLAKYVCQKVCCGDKCGKLDHRGKPLLEKLITSEDAPFRPEALVAAATADDAQDGDFKRALVLMEPLWAPLRQYCDRHQVRAAVCLDFNLVVS